MAKKIKAVHGKEITKVTFKKHLEALKEELLSTAKYIGLTKADIEQLKENMNADVIAEPEDMDEFVNVIEEVFPGFTQIM